MEVKTREGGWVKRLRQILLEARSKSSEAKHICCASEWYCDGCVADELVCGTALAEVGVFIV